MAKQQTDSGIERHISKDALEKLYVQVTAYERNAAEEGGSARAAIAKAVEKHNLVPGPFRLVKRWRKMDPGKAALEIRALMLYVDHFGLAAQQDIEDAIAADLEKEEDAEVEPEEAPPVAPTQDLTEAVEEALANGGEAALKRLRTALNDAGDVDGVQRGLSAFISDHPELSDRAHHVASERIAAIRAAAPEGGRRRRRPAGDSTTAAA